MIMSNNTQYQQLDKFITNYHNVQNKHGKPRWIYCCITKEILPASPQFVFSFDFKNDDARRAFGGLYYMLLMYDPQWTIQVSTHQIM